MLAKIIKNVFKCLIIVVGMLPVVVYAHQSTTTDWDYSTQQGPGNWGELAQDYALCAAGKQQSPINITQHAVETPKNEVDFHYGPGTFGRILDKRDFSVDVLPGSKEYIIFDGDRYELQGLHFHSPAEHQVARITYPLEVHFIHKNSQGKLLVVGVFFKEGKVNETLQKLFAVPLQKSNNDQTSQQSQIAFDPTRLIPKESGYYVYSGSLTTPPCTEGVTWLVMKKILNASSEQLEFFRTHIIHNNARPLQPLNQRTIYEHDED